jgi:hypothetical protein
VAKQLPKTTCTWHQRRCGQPHTIYPEPLHAYLRAKGKLQPSPCRNEHAPLRITSPADGSRYVLEPFRPAANQRPPLRALPAGLADARWTISGVDADRWVPVPGEHLVRVEHGGRRHEVTIHYEL